jgi:NADPH:quinone reductase-like Zn-dependent oxidoreductase
MPDEIPEAVAAHLHVNPLTAAMLVRAVERTGISPGDVVILTAAASQVAKLAATILLRKGYAPIGVVRSGGSMASAQAESVDMSIVTTEEPGWLERIRGIANGRPLRILLDPVGGELASAIISRMEGGTVIFYGDLSGQTINLPALAFSVHGNTITGVSVGGWGNLADDVRAADISTALELSRRDAGLFPIVGEYDLADVRQAVKHAGRPGKRGAVLLTSRLNTTGEG